MISKEEEDELRTIVTNGMNKQANIYAKPLLELIDHLRDQVDHLRDQVDQLTKEWNRLAGFHDDDE